MFRSSNDRRQRQFKKGIDADDARRRRDEISIKLRKEKRDEQLAKRRMRMNERKGNPSQAWPASGFGMGQGGMYPDGDLNEKLKALPELVMNLKSNDPKLQHSAVTQFRKLLSIGNLFLLQLLKCFTD